MADDIAQDADLSKDIEAVVNDLEKELNELANFRDYFFENHPIEQAEDKNSLVEEKRNVILEKLEAIDESQIPASLRAQFLYMKGRCYNIQQTYNPEAIAYLSKAVKLNPHIIEAWNELGECYWKNLNIKDAKSSFEGALKHEKNRISLRCLSILMRQEVGGSSLQEAAAGIIKSVELAREAVSLDATDGLSWSVLGNAYLCQYFMVAQEPVTLKSCMTAYRQAYQDPKARGQPDLYYNRGIALKYEERYAEAIESFEKACRLDPPWKPPQHELKRLLQYLHGVNELIKTKGKIKTKKLTQMIQSLDSKMLGPYAPGTFHTFGNRRNVTLTLTPLANLNEGVNEGRVVLAKVLGSIYSDNDVPFTFAITDASMACFSVTVYNWADGRGAIIGDTVAIPEPVVGFHRQDGEEGYSFFSIRVNNPLCQCLNGRRLGRHQFALTKVTSTYELQ